MIGVYLLSGALGLSIFATPDDFVAINVVLYIACQVWNDICELLSIKVPKHANRTGHHRLRLVRDRHLHAGGILHRHQELHVRCLGWHQQGWLILQWTSGHFRLKGGPQV